MPTPSNPFFNRQRITDPAYFSGRQNQVEQIYSAIVTRQSRSVVGERKLGKSSLLTYVMQATVMQDYGLDPARYIFIYLDLEGLTSATRPEFWLEIVEQCYARLDDEQLRRHFERYLEHDDEMRFTTTRRLLRSVRDAGLQVVCALDEFECLAENELFTPTFYGELRSLPGQRNGRRLPHRLQAQPLRPDLPQRNPAQLPHHLRRPSRPQDHHRARQSPLYIWAGATPQERWILLGAAEHLAHAESITFAELAAWLRQQQAPLDAARLPNVLAALEQRDILARPGRGQRRFRFKIDLVRRWIIANRQLRDTIGT